MIHGIGIDLVTIDRIQGVIDRHGKRLAQRVLHASELADYEKSTRAANFLAKRFAIKEAAVKALGTGERNGVLLSDFYVSHSELGKPILAADGEAARLCSEFGVNRYHVSVTDEGNQVIAYVILESCPSATA